MKASLVLLVFTVSVTQVFAQTNSSTSTISNVTTAVPVLSTTAPVIVTTAPSTLSSSAGTSSANSTTPNISGTSPPTATSGTSTVSQSNTTSTTKASSASITNTTVSPPGSTTTYSIITQTRLSTTAGPASVCQCVTTGFCEIAGGVSANDGSGKLNLRMSNYNSNVSQSGTPNAITSPASSGIAIVTSPPKTCDKRTERCCTSAYKCGLRFPPVQGSQTITSSIHASFGAYPWQGIILKANNTNVTSGALIDQWHFLTTAKNIKSYVKSASGLKLRMGEWNILSTAEPLPFREFQVESITVHPNYNELSSKNNIAIVKLKKAVNLGEFPTIGTACLPSSPIPAGIRCWASGWGYLQGNVTKADYQRQVDLPLVDPAVCQTELRATILGPKFVLDTSNFICAGGEPGKDTCNSGPGIPLVCEVASQFYLTGLTAWGMDCGKKDLPEVYVNVQSFVPWIQSIITPKTPATASTTSTVSPTSTTKK